MCPHHDGEGMSALFDSKAVIAGCQAALQHLGAGAADSCSQQADSCCQKLCSHAVNTNIYTDATTGHACNTFADQE
jgi:hypothetical protein